jgi:chromate transporter
MAHVLAERIADQRVTLTAILCEFLKVSLCSFGGGLVWARRFVVDQRQWVSDQEFTDILSVCQFMPGPNIIGVAVCVGAKLRGPIGAVAAALGFTLIPCAMGLPLGALYLRYAHSAVLHNVLGGVAAVAAGLLIATGIRMLRARRSGGMALLFAALTVAAVTMSKFPLIAILLGLAPLSIAAARVEAGRNA